MSNKQAYRNMQLREYSNYSQTYDLCKAKCVGNWDAHEQYPYEDYLLENYRGPREKALDFGCGMGRMMKRMLRSFRQVDGADLLQQNLEFAKQYLADDMGKCNLYLTDGLSCKIPNSNYDFAYSTICLQHICVHEIRYQILSDIYHLLSENGSMCIQIGYDWDNGTYWGDNNYDAQATNAFGDVSVPDQQHFPIIEKDLLDIGFKKIIFTLKESPHPGALDYHNTWLFIHCEK